MRVLVISDIHANLTALEAVLDAAGKVDSVWCLGDLVGYGPDPEACIERIRTLPNLICLEGNHDAAVLGQLQLEAFNHDARESIEWMQTQISPSSMDYLKSLPEKHVIGQVTLVHGSPRNAIWEYILEVHTASDNFPYFGTRYCMVGHTHQPIIYLWKSEGDYATWTLPMVGQSYKLTDRAILNPGSVGQPRDHDPRASYAIFDPDKSIWQVNRVAYHVEAVQERIKKAGLPIRHALRLTDGW
jgi:predicted phosphodiesterase